jgi:hypothetical protein
VADFPELAAIFGEKEKPSLTLTLPKPVTDKYFQDALEVGYPLIRAVASKRDHSMKFKN